MFQKHENEAGKALVLFPISIMLCGFGGGGGVTRGQNCTSWWRVNQKILQIPHLKSKYKMKQIEAERDNIFNKL